MNTLTVGIAGLGTIGKQVAATLLAGIPGLELVAVASGNPERARATMRQLDCLLPILDPEQLAQQVDVVVECAPTAAFTTIAEPALRAGCILVTVSGAAILQHPEIIALAASGDGRIILATGALLGLDAVRAAAEGTIHSITMVTRKPPASLLKAEYVVARGLRLEGLKEPLCIFKGNAREGAENFPANVNVAAALGLAGIGPDRTQLEIWADPGLARNTHIITVDADSARLELKIENVPTDENPGTGRITALSVIATLRGLNAPMRVGT